MTMGGFTQLQQTIGFAKVTGATGLSTPGTGNQNRDGLVTATARSSAGVYTVTLGSGGVDPRECKIDGALDKAGVAAEDIKWNQTSDTNIDVTTFNAAGAAADLNWSISIWKLAQVHA